MKPKVASQMFRNLVTQAGGKEAAAAIITSAVDHPISVGSLTRIENGNAEVPLLWAWALMDATHNACFDSYRAQTRDTGVESDPYTLIGETSKEHGEAVEAGLKAARSSSEEDWSRAAVEHREAADKHSEMASLCEVRAANLPKIGRASA